MHTSDTTRINSYAQVFSKPVDAFSALRKVAKTQTETHRVVCVMNNRRPVGFIVETQESLVRLQRNMPNLSFHPIFPKNSP